MKIRRHTRPAAAAVPPPHRPSKAKRVPRAGTFAAFVCSLPPTVLPTEAARRARAAGWVKATPQSVSSTRWYYDLVPPRPLLVDVAAAASTTSTTRTAHTVSIARHAPRDVPDELAQVIARYGTDATRRALAFMEARAAAVAADGGV